MTFTDLMERLENAQKTLLELKNEQMKNDRYGAGFVEEARLAGKLEGISLAISYLREYERVNDRN